MFTLVMMATFVPPLSLILITVLGQWSIPIILFIVVFTVIYGFVKKGFQLWEGTPTDWKSKPPELILPSWLLRLAEEIQILFYL